MDVYVLLGGIDYEGYFLLGVYHSREDAEAERDAYEKASDGSGYDFYDIQHRVVGARAKEQF